MVTTKDLLEWGPWIFNLLLVVVGALQVLLLRQTRQEMSLQRQEMSLQTRMTVERERAKLVVLFPPDKPEFSVLPNTEGRVAIKGLAVRIANYGYTDALDVKARGEVFTGDNKSEVVATRTRLEIPSPIKMMVDSRTVETTDSVLPYFTPDGSMTVMQETMDRLLNGDAHLRLVGSLTYKDNSGNARENSFDFLWVVKEVTEKGKRTDKSFWDPQSKNEAS